MEDLEPTRCECGAPISDLDLRLEDLVRAIALTPNHQLRVILEGFRAYEELIDQMPLATPQITDALAGGPIRRALSAVVTEVLTFKED